jgi:hypothetical protein
LCTSRDRFFIPRLGEQRVSPSGKSLFGKSKLDLEAKGPAALRNVLQSEI